MCSKLITKIDFKIAATGKPITDVIKAILKLLVKFPIVWLIVEISKFEDDIPPMPTLIPKSVKDASTSNTHSQN